jgi:uncharacterized protein
MRADPAIARLRRYAVARSLFASLELGAAVDRLGFVQIDPIRAPARAQDLILRHRAIDYRNGDLHRRYAELGLTEDHLHVYGIMPGNVRALIQPRTLAARWHVEREYPRLAPKIMAHVRRHGPTHPRDLQRALGKTSVVNAWGGQSSATTRVLEALHYRGALRIAHRVQGTRVYELAPESPRRAASALRAEGILALLLHVYAPLSVNTLRELAHMALGDTLAATRRNAAIDHYVDNAAVSRQELDHVVYLWPLVESGDGEPTTAVRLLAPFDPVVWDRRRFEHLWGWPYRFEAYTPPKKRRFGYYALPILWQDSVVGWANIGIDHDALVVGLGFAAPPRARAFRRELDAELARLATFLGVSHRPQITTAE